MEFWYNTSKHSSTQCSPFEVHLARHFSLSPASISSVSDVETMLTERTSMLAWVPQHLLRAQQRMKHQDDKCRSEHTFAVGDSVYLKLQPYIQSSLAPRAHQKLSFKYFGPFKIIGKIGSMAYASTDFNHTPSVSCLSPEASPIR